MIEMKGLNGAEAILRVLAAMGVERIFASPGSEWSPVWEAYARARAQSEGVPLYISSRHEETAVGMASGYAKATGKLPAVMIHTTVGALHASMAMRGALHEQVPMVVLAGESITFGESEGPDPGGQWLGSLADVGGPARLVEPCVKWSFGINTKSILPATIQRACQLAMATPRGPVFLSVPMEYQFEQMGEKPLPTASLPIAPAADPKGIEELARTLLSATSPVIVSEESGRNPRIVEQTVELAELLGAPVVETRSAAYVNFPRTHALHGGFNPGEYVKEADVIFFLGAVAPWHPPSAGPKEDAKVLVLHENPLRPELPYWGFKNDLCLAGEIESSLELLLAQVRKRAPKDDPARVQRREALAKRRQERKKMWQETALGFKERAPMDTRWVAYEVGRMLPADAMVVEETITHRLAIHQYLDTMKPGSFFAGCIGGLGTGLATALGVKAAAPKRPVICLIGDGAFNYDPALAALGCAQEHSLPILIVLFNNLGYLSMKTGVPKYYPDGWAKRTDTYVGTSIAPSPDYATIVRAFDGYGEQVAEPGQVGAAFERGLKAIAQGQTALLDMRLAPVSETMERPDR
ncbi:MAG TPA: thiamine pyrophosphate-binding protein [Candidatus Acidoferrales bacterium]|nr:thiamine pyrophosphate-binding protein [Candidatus Acidoferrales bacterium]